MLDITFTLAALIGGTVLVFQFVTMLLGLGHHGDISTSHDLSMSHDVDMSGVHTSSDHGGWHHSADGADPTNTISSWFYEVISIRTLSAAVTFFGLTGNTALAYGYSPLYSFVAATLAGLAAMYGVYWLFKQVYKLQHTGTENLRNALGAPAVVYIPIPGKRAGAGKVTFRLQNRSVEYLAVTEDDQRLATGEKVVVVALENAETVRVARVPASVPDMVSST